MKKLDNKKAVYSRVLISQKTKDYLKVYEHYEGYLINPNDLRVFHSKEEVDQFKRDAVEYIELSLDDVVLTPEEIAEVEQANREFGEQYRELVLKANH